MSKSIETAWRYALFIGAPVLIILSILWWSPHTVASVEHLPTTATTHSSSSSMPNVQLLLLQVLTIIGAALIVGKLMQKIGQPRVVGEMLAGIVLGPSVLGNTFPELSNLIFPAASLGFLNSLSQIGLVFFMFLVGLEIDPKQLKDKGHAAVLTSHASITAPFLLGVILAIGIYKKLAPAGVGFTPFALFLGAAMSVTAFPVLARILSERNMMQDKVGSLAIVCAAMDDVTAWCILAMVVAIASAGSDMSSLFFTLGGTALYTSVMIWGVRPLLKRLEKGITQGHGSSPNTVAVVAVTVIGSAIITDMLGIHSLFGAFLAGAIMPRGEAFVNSLVQKFEDVMVVVLLPIFFAFTGLRTSISLINGTEMWLICLLIVAVAVLGKLGGSAVAARSSGLSWKEAGTIGVLMNTRGLMELIILNVGLDIGLISPTLFAMMVIMALVTTFMTSPLLSLISPKSKA